MKNSGHWLQGVLERSGRLKSEGFTLSPGIQLQDAWREGLAVTGMEEGELADLVAKHFRLARADFQLAEAKALKLVPESVAQEFLVFPIKENYKRIEIATADPTNYEAEQAIGFASGRSVTFEIASPGEIEQALITHYSTDNAVAKILDRVKPGLDESLDQVRLVEEEEEEAPPLEAVAAGPVVNLTNVILREAVEARASDIHLQPTSHGGVIRYRVDGVLRNSGNMPLPVLARVVSRIKIMAKLDIADRLRPQDGRAKVAFGSRTVDLRISTVPTRNAEKVVIRILDTQETPSLEDVGILEPELSRFRHLLSHREGIVVVTGPTGSGKTTSLYAALKHIHTEGINIMTVEDPVEYDIPDVTQIQVEPKQGVTFASALRAILRQDPDVVFVGEIRDKETAEMAAQASLTGHLVLSTLHTNDAVATVGRFTDIGLDRPTLAETLRGALAQRLVRRICPSCAIPVDDTLTEEEAFLAAEYGVQPPLRAVGCEDCGHTGYQGRLPLVEVMTVTTRIKELIAGEASSVELHEVVREQGERDLRAVGVQRVKAGDTTLQELERVLGDVGARAADPREASIPLSVPAAGSSAAAAPAAEQPGDLAEIETSTPRILLVDDDGANRTIARALLESENFEVAEASDGVEAVEVLRASTAFSLVVLDLDMPRMGGREVLKRIRGNMATVGLPVIVLTGTTDADTEFTLMEEGADDYIRKPFDPRRFMTRVRAALRRAGG